MVRPSLVVVLVNFTLTARTLHEPLTSIIPRVQGQEYTMYRLLTDCDLLNQEYTMYRLLTDRDLLNQEYTMYRLLTDCDLLNHGGEGFFLAC